MKENKEVNEAFVAFHEEMAGQGKTRDEIIALAIPKFNLGGKDSRHTYRAWVARLADKTKYQGRFSERMKRFQTQPKKKGLALAKTEGEGEGGIEIIEVSGDGTLEVTEVSVS